MSTIELIKLNPTANDAEPAKDKHVNQLFNGPFRQIVEVCLKNNAVLTRHKADVPITVYCVSGKGVFTAGADLADSAGLVAGTLLTLEAGVEHEVTADPELHLIVSKFKDS